MTNEQELAFLRYFYDSASSYMGPADMDIYDEIKRNYKHEGGSLGDYDFEDEEEEEE